MSDADAPRRTPLHDDHVALGGRMVAFAGWNMPVQYSSVIEEHNAVRESAGLFDVSHMGEVVVRGPQSLHYLQHLTCNDVSRLTPGRAHYTGLITPDGGFVDDLLLYKRAANDYLLVINAANRIKDVDWLAGHGVDYDVEVADVSAEWAQIAIQGPRAQAILQARVREPLDEIRYYRFVTAAVEGAECIVSRTGYTGEDGFEIYSPHDAGSAIWRALLEAGGGQGLQPVGLAARDTLRLEARMALYGNDIDETTTVLEADLGWIVKLKKGPFIGRDVLERQNAEGVTRKLIGFEMRGRAIARHGYSAHHHGVEVGRVTSGSFAPYLKRNIGLAYLPIELTRPGTEFQVELRGRREPAVVVETPFYRRPS